MGNWRIVIHGIGAHHNQSNATDADQIARNTLGVLIDAGHQITAARFEHSQGYEDLVPGRAVPEHQIPSDGPEPAARADESD